MPAVPVIAGVSAAVSVGSTIYSAIETNKARKAQQRNTRLQRQIANNRAQRQRTQAIRQARLARGALEQTAANSGAALSSIALGGLGSIQSQLNSNLSFLDTNQTLSSLAAVQSDKAASALGSAQLASDIGGVASQIFGSVGGVGAFEGKKGK